MDLQLIANLGPLVIVMVIAKLVSGADTKFVILITILLLTAAWLSELGEVAAPPREPIECKQEDK